MQNFDQIASWFRRSGSSVISFGIGTIFGTFFLGLRTVLPWNLNWLSGKGDGSADLRIFRFFSQLFILRVFLQHITSMRSILAFF